MSTALDIIKDAMKLIGALAAGETPSSEESADALRSLNLMLDSWNTESLTIYEKRNDLVSASANVATYTIATGQTWNVPRPMKIEQAFARLNSIDYPIDVIINEQYIDISDKTEIADIPTHLYYKPTYPYGAVTLWPIPNQTITIGLTQLSKLSSFASTATTVSLPEGYEVALVFNLALELWYQYNKNIDPSAGLVAKAREYKGNIKAVNLEPIYLDNDAVMLSSDYETFDVYAGE